MGETRSENSSLYVVGIGASAGGLDALERFFDSLPATTGVAFVIVQHLSPDFRSLMDELLARHTSLPIRLVEDGMRVEPDHVYLIPPRKEMIISGGRLLLSERDRQQELTLPIDVFFRTLAEDCGPRAIGVVLSGGGSDGSRGARHIRDAGGLVLVQDTESAQFDGMPRNARDAGVAHYVLAPAEMPAVLLAHVAERMRGAGEHDVESGRLDPQGINAVYGMLEAEFGIDFTHYKPSTVTRRIERRVQLARSQDLDEYVSRLRSERGELDVLYRDLLIGVTRFFRDEKAFELLEQQILPELFQRTSKDTPIRIWVAGCATGEEPYSLAILLQDLQLKYGERPIKIFATDVHRGSLERAARALYDESAVRSVSPERLERYFWRTGSMYQVVPDLRQMIVFAAHNVIRDAPFTRVDLITCRNLLIYLQPFAQQKVLSLFHFALNRGGTLFLGSSESTGPLTQHFTPLEKHWRLYQKRTDFRPPLDGRVPAVSAPDPRSSARLQPQSGRYSLTQLLGTYDALLEEVMPPSLLVSERGELIHAFNGASRFLRMQDGRQGLDVLDVVSSELKMVLVGGLKRALGEPTSLVFRGVRACPSEEDKQYKVTIRRIRSRSADAAHLLIAFEEMELSSASRRAIGETEIDLHQVSSDQLASLEAELNHTRENLQAAIEELETSNEELQASNEELQASNEELQSTNEELQSVNEELYTVNSEYQRKITELTELTNDMDNLLSSTEVGTIFLDGQLRIRKFTPQIAETFSLLAHDVGRPIQTFAHKLEHPELLPDLQRVLETGTPVERELRGDRGRSFFSRIFPYRAKGGVGGVVLTMIDVTGLKAAEDALFHERYLLNSLLGSVPDAIYFKDSQGRFIRANQAMATRLGLSHAREAVGKLASELPNRAFALALDQQDAAVLRTGEAQHYRLEKRVLATGQPEWDLVTRLPLKDSERIVGIIVIFRTVTEQKRAEEKIQEAVRRRDQFLAMLSHELRNPLGAVVTATTLLKNEISASASSARLLDVLERQSQQMARLLDDLLEASRVTQNKIELRRGVVDLRAAVKDAADAVTALMRSRGLHFTVNLEQEPIHVDGDPARLQQIQVNLLSNAAKYTEPGGHVVLGVKREQGMAVLSVRDSGAGIPRDMLESIFELFVQSSRTLDRAAGGLGVGLTLVRSLVAMHGGTIEVNSDGEGRGSEFVVRLPLVAGVPAEEPELLRPRLRVPAHAKIVIVEDNKDAREMLCELLEHARFECHTADTGPEALRVIDQVKPDIAILDVGLPEMDGYEVARRLRKHPEHARMVLIALTGYGRASDRAESRAAGFDEHLVKPVHAEQLLRILTSMQEGSTRKRDGASEVWHAEPRRPHDLTPLPD